MFNFDVYKTNEHLQVVQLVAYIFKPTRANLLEVAVVPKDTHENDIVTPKLSGRLQYVDEAARFG